MRGGGALMIIHLFKQARRAVIIKSERCGPSHYANAGFLYGLDQRLAPRFGCVICAVKQISAQFKILFHQKHVFARLGGGQRCH